MLLLPPCSNSLVSLCQLIVPKEHFHVVGSSSFHPLLCVCITDTLAPLKYLKSQSTFSLHIFMAVTAGCGVTEGLSTPTPLNTNSLKLKVQKLRKLHLTCSDRMKNRSFTIIRRSYTYRQYVIVTNALNYNSYTICKDNSFAASSLVFDLSFHF